MAWSEESRVPTGSESMGGMSGGPVLNEDGMVIGVVLAESVRRGRTFTAVPATIDHVIRLAASGVAESHSTDHVSGPISADDYMHYGRAVIMGVTVARVVCMDD